MTRPVMLSLAVTIGLAACEGRAAPAASAPAARALSTPATTVAWHPVPDGPFGLGRKPTAAEVAAWDIDVNPEGKNLPPGRGTPAEGKQLYAERCAACHGQTGEGTLPLYPRLVGREPTDFSFADDFNKHHTIGNYWPYATTLYDYINRAMPLTAPGSLTPPQVYSLVAYLLAANGVIAEDAIIDRKTLPAVKMPGRNHFVPDNRTGGENFR